MEVSSKDRLIEAGMAMLLLRGYNHLGIQDVLAATDLPKGSFYHHFESKEDFALAVVDRYMAAVHQGLDACLLDDAVAPLQRIRNFFEATRESYKGEGYLGCLLGGLGQELSGVSETFRIRIEQCIGEIANKIEVCLRLAVARGDIATAENPRHLAALLVNCWEGAALRTRLLRDPAPLGAMLDFYFRSISPQSPRRRSARKKPARAARKRR
jgi:TetR/AcrR family transcriptional regulator, transcriptional repressor for nem operon